MAIDSHVFPVLAAHVQPQQSSVREVQWASLSFFKVVDLIFLGRKIQQILFLA